MYNIFYIRIHYRWQCTACSLFHSTAFFSLSKLSMSCHVITTLIALFVSCRNTCISGEEWSFSLILSLNKNVLPQTLSIAHYFHQVFRTGTEEESKGVIEKKEASIYFIISKLSHHHYRKNV